VFILYPYDSIMPALCHVHQTFLLVGSSAVQDRFLGKDSSTSVDTLRLRWLVSEHNLINVDWAPLHRQATSIAHALWRA
jgi:hypothetical protein